MSPQLDMVGITTRDIAESLRFYRALGLEIPEVTEGEDHVESVTGGMRLAWDTIEVVKGIIGEWEEPKGNRIELAFKCEDRDDVDATYNGVVGSGFKGIRPAWDAFWGQRYAILEDPDGNHISLFA